MLLYDVSLALNTIVSCLVNFETQVLLRTHVTIVHVCVCARACVCVRVRACVRACVCESVRVCLFVFVCMGARQCVPACMSVRARIHACAYPYIFVTRNDPNV